LPVIRAVNSNLPAAALTGASIARMRRICATMRLLDYYFVREQKRGGAVVELHQVHAPIQVIYLADDPWLFAETAAPFMVAHRLLQLAMFPDQYFTIYASHHIFTPPRPPCTSCFLILTDILASFGPDI
jgi:hypothetical protein